MNYLIIGDVAGELDALERLIAKAPAHDKRIYLGDVVDRGQKSAETLRYVMEDCKLNGAVCVYGNHEDMMYQTLNKGKFYWLQNWMVNGGLPTYEGFKKFPEALQIELLQFLAEMPAYYEGPGFVCSHAPMAAFKDLVEVQPYLDRGGEEALQTFVWCRNDPWPWDFKTQFYGHNGKYHEHVTRGNDSRKYAYCVDDTHNGNIAAVHWPSLEVVKEDYRNVPEIIAPKPEPVR